ncbi:MAG: gluconeogenesis factor YvcK family protein [Patescibacteria group bacterium]
MPKKRNKKHFVVIGGGTGTFTVLTALKKYPVKLSAIVSMADDGKSTGVLRDQYGVLPPGDVRRALVALSEDSSLMRKLFEYRFENGDFAGHNVGNLFLSALEKITGNFAEAVEESSKILNIKGKVIPVTLDNVRLYAGLLDGTVIKGETNIDIPKAGKKRAPIEDIWLEPSAKIHEVAREVILDADVIVIGPGDLYTSLIPNFLVRGVCDAILCSDAKKVYICNLMTKFGETDGFGAEQFIYKIEKYAGKNTLDFVLCNARKPSDRVLQEYQKEGSEFVDFSELDRFKAKPKIILENFMQEGSLVRHNPEKLAEVLLKI